MKKTSKKLLTLALTLIMALALAIPSMAASITITNGNPNATYEAYKLLELTVGTTPTCGIEESADHTHGETCYPHSYTVNSKYATILSQAVSACGGEGDVIAYLGTLDADGTRTFANKVFELLGETSADYTNDQLNNVEQGYYLIVETTSFGDDPTNISRSLVMLDTAGHDDIEIESKMAVPQVDKSVTEDSTSAEGTSADFDINQEISFKLTGTVTNYTDEFETYSYTFHDTFPAGMEYVENSVGVKIGDTDVTTSFTTSFADGKLTVSCTDLTGVDAATPGSTITVTYKAKLTDTAAINEDLTNSVYIEYSSDPYDEEATAVTTTETATVKTYQLTVNKYADADNDNVKDEGEASLANAYFNLTKVVDGSTMYATASGENGVYVITGWTDTEPEVGTFVSPETGTIVIKGLDSDTYALIETAAPDGYNLLKDPVSVQISSDNYSVDVANHTGTELPETGGIGTTLFYVVGGALVLGAAVLLITKKRVHDAED